MNSMIDLQTEWLEQREHWFAIASQALYKKAEYSPCDWMVSSSQRSRRSKCDPDCPYCMGKGCRVQYYDHRSPSEIEAHLGDCPGGVCGEYLARFPLISRTDWFASRRADRDRDFGCMVEYLLEGRRAAWAQAA
jgi:hypothetical protein